MDKTAEVIRTKKKDKVNEIADGIVYDKTTKDSEIVKLTEDVETYFAREVYPHVPDAHYWFDEEKAMELRFRLPVISITTKHQKVRKSSWQSSMT